MPLEITQYQYITYIQYIDDITKIGEYYINNMKDFKHDPQKLFMIALKQVDLPKSNKLTELKIRIKFINAIHLQLAGSLMEKSITDNAPLAATYYNTHLKAITAWNKIFKDTVHYNIITPNNDKNPLQPSIYEKTVEEITSQKMIADYCNLLDQYPKLKREGDLNNHKLRTYEIVYDKAEISCIQKNRYDQLYKKAKEQNKSDFEAYKIAQEGSKAGLVFENQFWIILSDVVKFPNGAEGIYSRHIQKTDLANIGGVAVLPIVKVGNEKKIILILTFRHATQNWEFELPRGGSQKGETPEETARREAKQEIKREVTNLVRLGEMTPDSGLTASIIPVYLGEGLEETQEFSDGKEAIKGKYSFTIPEIKEGLKKGYLEVELNGKMTSIPFRDPFLTYALYLAECNDLLSEKSSSKKEGNHQTEFNKLLRDKFPENKYENIGKRGFQWKREYLAWNEKKQSFYFEQLNFIQVIFRKLFGCWSHTHLSFVLTKIKKENLPEEFLLRMKMLWESKYSKKTCPLNLNNGKNI